MAEKYQVANYTDHISKVLALCPSTRVILLAAECCVDLEILDLDIMIQAFAILAREGFIPIGWDLDRKTLFIARERDLEQTF